eukprot:4733616-Alexandrium_andersonii.AAC.1
MQTWPRDRWTRRAHLPSLVRQLWLAGAMASSSLSPRRGGGAGAAQAGLTGASLRSWLTSSPPRAPALPVKPLAPGW